MYLEQKSCLFLDRTFTEKEENYHQEIQNLKIKIQVCLVYVMSFDIFIALIRVVKTFSFKLIIKFKKQKLSISIHVSLVNVNSGLFWLNVGCTR